MEPSRSRINYSVSFYSQIFNGHECDHINKLELVGTTVTKYKWQKQHDTEESEKVVDEFLVSPCQEVRKKKMSERKCADNMCKAC